MSYMTEVLADAPAALLMLDDATTSFTDSSGNSHNQTVSGTVTAAQAGVSTEITASALFGGGRIDEDFGSADSYSALTVEAWYKSTNGNGTLWTSRGATGNGFTLFVGVTGAGFGSAGQVSWGLDGAGLYQGICTSATVHDGSWHHIVGVFSRSSGTIGPSDFSIYVDGALQSVTQRPINGSTNVPVTSSHNWAIGQHLAGWSNGTLSANLAAVAVYSSALSSSRVSAHYLAAAVPRAGSIMSRMSASLLIDDTLANRSISRQSVTAIVNDNEIRRVLSRMSVQVLIPTAPRYRGWGIGR
jgi:hypothetical protein